MVNADATISFGSFLLMNPIDVQPNKMGTAEFAEITKKQKIGYRLREVLGKKAKIRETMRVQRFSASFNANEKD